MSRSKAIALLNIEVESGEALVNEAAIVAAASAAADEGAEFVFAPELAVTGYAKARFRELAQHLDGPIVGRMREFARERGITIGFGMVLERDGSLYNAYVIASAIGVVAFGKLHRWWHGDSSFTPWPDLRVIEISGLKIGVMVCFDGRFPEAARIMALQGADVIVWPCSWPKPPLSDPTYMEIIGKARAFENQVYVALTNRKGDSSEEKSSYAGMSSLWGPKGDLIARARDDEDVLIGRIDFDLLREVRSTNDIYRERRPDLYKYICERQGPNSVRSPKL
ncbi:MAG: carbon-nitrogen hydrolase family protein [Candidatus Brocadiia bacterium]